MSAFPSCSHGHNDPNFPCKACESDRAITALKSMILRLKETLADLNDCDSAAEGENASNFSHRRADIDSLCAESELMVKHI